MLAKLGRYEKAITSFDRAIEIEPDDYVLWYNRAISFYSHGYQAQINAYHQAFEHIHPDTHPEGYGFLQHQIGRTHYQEGINQLFNYRRSPQSYYDLALTSYQNALQTLTLQDFTLPELNILPLRLEILIDTAKAYLAKGKDYISAARECQTEALTIWLRQINDVRPQEKKRLYLEYNHLLRTQVDLSILDGEPIRALEIAEFDKNKHLEWFLYSQEQQGQTASLLLKEIEQLRLNVVGLQYPQMRQLLAPNRAIIYWHLSPDHITTFILHPHNPNPQILTTTYLPSIQIGLNLQAKPQPDSHPVREASALAKRLRQRAAGFLPIESPDYSQPTKLKKITKTFGLLTNPEIESAIIAHLFQPKTIIPTGSVKKKDLCAAFNTPHTYGHFNGHAYHDPRRPQNAEAAAQENPTAKPYSNPYYWAAFTISGWG